MSKLLEWIRDIIIALVIALVIMAFLKPMVVQEESMVSTFFDGDYIVVGRQSYNIFGDIKRGDVVVFKSHIYDEHENPKNLIKRIIGLPGDTVEIKDGSVYLNGEMLDEEYVKEPGKSGNMALITVPDGEVFVMGDNREVSEDSRSPRVGCVETDAILGKVLIRLYPFDDIKIF